VHACCSANSHTQSIQSIIDEFIALNPQLFHIADNKLETIIDEHLHFGTGSLPLKQIISQLPKSQRITLESTKNHNDFYNLARSEAEKYMPN